MFKKILKAAIVLGIGIGIGSLFNVGEKKSTVSNKIAIVNEDEGVLVDGQQKSFAKDMFSVSSNEVVLTGMTSAKEGLLDGTYAAIVVVPRDFSKNIISINSNPTKTTIKYFLSDDLDDTQAKETLEIIYSFEKELNTNIGFMYVRAIKNAFVAGQREAEAVLSNDEKDHQLITSISPYDLTANLTLSEVKEVENQIMKLDLSSHTEYSKKLINDIDGSYKDDLKMSEIELNSLKTAMTTFNNDFDSATTTLDQFRFISLDDDSTANYQLSSLSNHLKTNEGINYTQFTEIKTNVVKLNTLHKSVTDEYEKFYTNINNVYEANINAIQSSQLNATFTSQITSKTNGLKTEVDKRTAEGNATIEQLSSEIKALEKQLEDMGQTPVSKGKPEIQNCVTNVEGCKISLDKDGKHLITSYETDMKEIILNEVKNTQSILNDTFGSITLNKTIITQNNVSFTVLVDTVGQTVFERFNINTIKSSVAQDLSELNKEQQQIINDLKTDLIEKETTINTVTQQQGAYDPLSYIDQANILALVESLKASNELSQKVSIDKNEEYINLNNEVYQVAGSHINELRNDIQEAHQQSNEKVTNGLAGAINSRTETSKSNQTSLGTFVNQLPYLKNENTAILVEDFITNPVNLRTELAAIVGKKTTISPVTLIGIGLAVVAFVLLLINNLLDKRKETVEGPVSNNKEIM